MSGRKTSPHFRHFDIRQASFFPHFAQAYGGSSVTCRVAVKVSLHARQRARTWKSVRAEALSLPPLRVTYSTTANPRMTTMATIWMVLDNAPYLLTSGL
jgi:hypothetical protein